MLHAFIVSRPQKRDRTFLIVSHSGNSTYTGRTDRFRVHEIEALTSNASKPNEPYVRDWTYKVAKLWKCRYAETLGTLAIGGGGYCKLDALKETVIALVNKGEL
jgi:hypothetical protein